MAMKRVFGKDHVEERESPAWEREAKRALITPSVLTEVAISELAEEICVRMVPHFRNLMEEVMTGAFGCYIPRGLGLNQTVIPQATRWKLHLSNQLPSTIFTCCSIDTEDGSPIQVHVLDCDSNVLVACGPPSSLKAEIVVLKGNFGEEGVEDWNEEEFDANVISERKGKQPLLTGDLLVTITDGVGSLGKVKFTDNSSWTKSRKFRIGVKVIPSCCPGVRIREARSGAFVVKDYRGESYRKLHPPSLVDDVWRLERIRKDGTYHKKLLEHGIRTVEDFLKCLVIDSSGLQNNILGGLPDRKWKTITQHARECSVNDKLYEFNADGVCLRLNSVYEVVGATFFGEGYKDQHEFTTNEKNIVETLKQVAYNNQQNITPLVGQSSQIYPIPCLHQTFVTIDPGHEDTQPGEHMNVQNAASDWHHELPKSPSNTEILATLPIFSQWPYVPDPSNGISSATPLCQPEEHPENNWAGPEEHPENNWAGPEEHPENNWAGYFPASSGHWSEPQIINYLSENFPSTSFHGGIPCKRTKWFKVRTVMKVGISVRKDVAARRTASLVQEGY